MDKLKLALSTELRAALDVVLKSSSKAIAIVPACSKISDIAEACVSDDSEDSDNTNDPDYLADVRTAAALLATLRRHEDRAVVCAALLKALAGCARCKASPHHDSPWNLDALVPAVLVALRRHVKHADVVRNACYLLWIQVNDRDFGNVSRFDICLAMLGALRCHIVHADVVASAADAIGIVLHSDESYGVHLLLTDGVCETVTDALRRHRSLVAEECAVLLRRIVALCPAAADRLLDVGLPEVAAACLRGEGSKSIWYLLGDLCTSAASFHALAAVGIVDSAVAGLDSAVAGLRSSACLIADTTDFLGAVQRFAAVREARPVLMAAGAVAAVATAAQRLSAGGSSFLDLAFGALAMLSTDEEACEPLVAAGCLAPVRAWLESDSAVDFTCGSEVTKYACEVARNIAAVPACRAAVVEAGFPTLLGRLLALKCDNKDIQPMACAALRNLAASPELRLTVHHCGATAAALRRLDSDSVTWPSLWGLLFGLSLEPAACAVIAGLPLARRALQALQAKPGATEQSWAICGLLLKILPLLPDDELAIVLREPVPSKSETAAARTHADALLRALLAHAADPRVSGAFGVLILRLGPASRAAVAARGAADTVRDALAHAAACGSASAETALAAAAAALAALA